MTYGITKFLLLFLIQYVHLEFKTRRSGSDRRTVTDLTPSLESNYVPIIAMCEYIARETRISISRNFDSCQNSYFPNNKYEKWYFYARDYGWRERREVEVFTAFYWTSPFLLFWVAK